MGLLGKKSVGNAEHDSAVLKFQAADRAWKAVENDPPSPEKDAIREAREAALELALALNPASGSPHSASRASRPPAQAQLPTQPSGIAQRKRFEYHWEMWLGSRGYLGPGSVGDIASFNALGREGWELVAMYDRVVLFKRELLD